MTVSPLVESNVAPHHPWLRWGIRLLIIGAVLAASARLVRRGFSEALDVAPDLRPTFLSSRAWAHGQNPYDAAALTSEWNAVRQPRDASLPADFFGQEPSLYPPPTFVIIWPLTLAPWHVVRIFWFSLSVLTTVLAWLALVRMAGIQMWSWRAGLFGAIWLQFGPLHTLLHLANPTLLTINIIILAVYCATFQWEVAGAVLLAFAVCLKPQLGGAVLVYYALSRRWRLFGTTATIVAAVSLVALARLSIAHVDWLPNLMTNMRVASTNGGLDDPSPINPLRWHLINLQFPLYGLLHTPTIVSEAAWLITLYLCLLFVLSWIRCDFREFEPLTVSVPLILALLPLYHSYYDALLLVIPLAWAIAAIGTEESAYAWATIACTGPFYVCFAWVVDNLVLKGRIPMRIAETAWFNTWVLPCETWALIAMSILLMRVIQRRGMIAQASGVPASQQRALKT